MIEQQARVVAVTGGKASVRLGGTTGCAHCDAGKGCGAGIFGRLLKRKPLTLELENSVGAQPGQPVMVGVPELVFLKLVAKLYLLPLLAGLAGAALGHYLSVTGQLTPVGTDMLTLLAGLTCGAAALAWIKKSDREFPGSFIVHLLRIVNMQETGN